MEEKNKIIDGTLYLVTTPLGNLDDITYRAIKVLTHVDFIAAEDTRVTGKLLSALEIKDKKIIPYHEHNKKEAGPKIVQNLLSGQSCALVTDAGTPAISDPGADLVQLCIKNNIPFTAIPGCSALVNAVVLSGLDTTKFVFEGFLSAEKNVKKKRLEELSSEERTMIIYEAPHKLLSTLEYMTESFGEERKIALCREMTKLNEEILRLTLGEAGKYFENHEPRGEYVLVVEGKSTTDDAFWKDMTIKEHFEYYSVKMSLEKMSAIKAVAKDRGVSKNTIYKQLL